MKDDQSFERNDRERTRGFQVNRREFLKIAGSGIFVFFTLGDALFLQQEGWGREPLPTDFNAFLRIAEDGRVSCYTGKIEMGQGIVTSLTRIFAPGTWGPSVPDQRVFSDRPFEPPGPRQGAFYWNWHQNISKHRSMS